MWNWLLKNKCAEKASKYIPCAITRFLEVILGSFVFIKLVILLTEHYKNVGKIINKVI